MIPTIRVTYADPPVYRSSQRGGYTSVSADHIWTQFESLFQRAVDDDQRMLICRHYYRNLLYDNASLRDQCIWQVMCFGHGTHGARIAILETDANVQKETLYLVTGGYLLDAVNATGDFGKALAVIRHFDWHAAESGR